MLSPYPQRLTACETREPTTWTLRANHGLGPLLNTYNLLDLTPLGRQEEEGIMRWLRHLDKY